MKPWHEKENWFELYSPKNVDDDQEYPKLYDRAIASLRLLADKTYDAVKDGDRTLIRQLAKDFDGPMHVEFRKTGIGDTEPRSRMAEVVYMAAKGEGYTDERLDEMASMFRWGALVLS